MAVQFRVGDVGSTFRVWLTENGVPFDVHEATVQTLKLQRPDGTVVNKTTVFETTGVDGRVKYTTTAITDLDQPGPWQGQMYVELPIGKWHSSRFSFSVGANLS